MTLTLQQLTRAWTFHLVDCLDTLREQLQLVKGSGDGLPRSCASGSTREDSNQSNKQFRKKAIADHQQREEYSTLPCLTESSIIHHDQVLFHHSYFYYHRWNVCSVGPSIYI